MTRVRQPERRGVLFGTARAREGAAPALPAAAVCGNPAAKAQVARPLVVRYMQYLKRMGIGMLAWTLAPGSLNGSRHGFYSVSFEPQGDGYLVRHWFAYLAGQAVPGPQS